MQSHELELISLMYDGMPRMLGRPRLDRDDLTTDRRRTITANDPS
jgi:hypothetical protein